MIKSKNWNMFKENEKLFITKGSDEIYFLDEVRDEQVDELYDAYVNNNFDKLLKNSSFSSILSKLEKVGVIYKKKLKTRKKIKIYLKYYGIPTVKLKNSIGTILLKSEKIDIVDVIDDCDLLLIIRINGILKEILEGYDKINKPHLFIDLAYSHNISIGPLVFKGETSCLGCFIGRLTKNWGDLVPPSCPDVTKRFELISALINKKVDEFIEFGNCPDLINKVWNFNIDSFNSSYNTVYKLPWCPTCGNKYDNEKLDLSWVNEEIFNENK